MKRLTNAETIEILCPPLLGILSVGIVNSRVAPQSENSWSPERSTRWWDRSNLRSLSCQHCNPQLQWASWLADVAVDLIITIIIIIIIIIIFNDSMSLSRRDLSAQRHAGSSLDLLALRGHERNDDERQHDLEQLHLEWVVLRVCSLTRSLLLKSAGGDATRTSGLP